MYVQTHRLEDEFPALATRLQALRQNDPQFAKLLAEYDALDREICDLEARDMPISDLEIEDLKKRRVALKDTLYTRMSAEA